MATITAIASGRWSADAATVWSSGAAPTSADDVVTPAATNLTSITIATSKFNLNAHGLSDGDEIVLATTGALPTGVNPRVTPYFVVNKTTNDFQLSLTSGGAAITLSGSQSGTHSFNKRFTLTLDTTGLICKTITLGSGWKLVASTTANSALTVQNAAAALIGSEVNIDMSSAPTYSCTIKLNGAATGAAWYGMDCGYGMVACKMIGAERTRWTRLNGGISAGVESATVDLATGWRAGDILVLGSTSAYDGTTRVDIVTLDSNYVAGSTSLSWDNAYSGSGPTTYAHADNCYVGNLSSNMTITSADTSATSKYAKGITITTRYNASERTNCPVGSKVLRDVAFYKVGPNQFNYPSLSIVSGSGSGGRYSFGAIERCAFSYHANYCINTTYQDPYVEIPLDDNIFYTPNTSSWRYDINLTNSFLASRPWNRNVHFAAGANGTVVGMGNSSIEFMDGVSMCSTAFLATAQGAANFKATRVSMLSSRYATSSHGLGSFEYVDCDWGTEFGATNALGAGFIALQYSAEQKITGGTFQSGVMVDESTIRSVGQLALSCLVRNKDNDAALQYLYQRAGNVTRDESIRQNGDASLRFEPKVLGESFSYSFDVLVPPSTTLTLKGNTQRDTATTNFSVAATLAGVAVDSFTHSAAINTWEPFSLALSHVSAVAQNIKVEISCSDASVVTGKAYIDGIPDFPFCNKVRWYGYNYDETSKTRTVNAAITETTEATAYAYTGIAVGTGTAPALTGITLTVAHSFVELYDYTQAWARANIAYNVPVTASVAGMLTAQCNLTATAAALSGAGSILMGSYTLTASGYTYTGGTFSQLASTPAFSGGTVSIAAEGTYDYTLSSCGVEFGAAGTAWDLSGSTFSGTIALTTSTGALAVTVAVPAGASYTTEGANITVTYPTVARGLDFNTPLPGSTVKVFATGTQTVIATPTGPDWLWSEGVAGSVTVDYTVQKVGYDPIRVTGVTVTAAISGGIQAVAVQQQVARSYVASSGLTFDTNCYADPDTKLFGLANATKSTLQNFYSHMVESWITEPALQNKPFPITPNGPNSFTLGDGWVWDLTTYPNSIANLRGDGQRYVNAFGNVTAIWAAVMSVGVPAGMQVRYQQVDGTGTTNAASTGDMNELVQILSDPNGDGTYTDGYDKRGWLVLKVQEEGYDQSEAVAANGLSTGSIYGTLEDQLYVVGLTPLPNGVAAWGAADDTSITITFEPTPVTWNGQQFSCTIEDTLDGRSGLEIMQIIRARELFNLHDMIRVNGTKFKTVNGNLYGDAYTTPAGVRVVKADGTTAHADFDLFESDTAGSYYTPPVTAPVVWAGAVDGSTVLLYNDSSATPTVPIAAATVTNSSGGYLWNITLPHADVAAGDSLRLRYGHKQYYADELQGTMTSNGLAFVGSMTLHPVYASWGLNGATYDQLYGGPFTMDGLNLQIDIAAGATSGTKVQLGAWTQYLMTLPAGLDAFYGAWDLLAVNQIRQNTTIINVKIDVPVDGALFTFTDNNVNYYRSDFSYPGNVETGHGLIAITYDASPFVATVASSYAITGSIDDVAAKVQIGMTSQGYTTTRAPKLDNLDAAVSTRMAGADFVVPPTPEANAAAVFTQAGLTPMPSDMKKTNDEDIIGDGTPANKFRSHLVP